jgi:Xaa-Pro aminopeptidase
LFATRGILEAPGVTSSRLAAAMEDADLDIAIVSNPENVFYLTGYPGLPSSGNPILYSLRNIFPFSVVIERSGDRHLLCWGFSVQGVDVPVEHLVPFGSGTAAAEALASLLRTMRPRTIGLESTAPHNTVVLASEAMPDAALSFTFDVTLLNLRKVKTPREIELLQKSVDVAEGALSRVLSALTLGCSRIDMIRVAKVSVLDLGGDGVGHVTMNFGSANPEIAIDEIMTSGDLAILDVGAKYQGYTSDCRRYAFAGTPPANVVGRHQAMVDLVSSVAARIRPGVRYSELYAVAMSGYREIGLEPPAPLSHVGHSIGLETEEEWISNDPEGVIEENMVLAIELYTPSGLGGNIGDEETYVVTSTGMDLLCRLDTSIRSF